MCADMMQLENFIVYIYIEGYKPFKCSQNQSPSSKFSGGHASRPLRVGMLHMPSTCASHTGYQKVRSTHVIGRNSK